MKGDRGDDSKEAKYRKAVTFFGATLLVSGLVLWSPALTVSAQERPETPSGVAGPIQGLPRDPAVPALEKEKLALQVEQLKKQNASAWTRYLTPFATPFSIVVTLLVAAGGYFRWVREQHGEREKRDEDRFQAVVSGLGSGDVGAKVGAAIMLRTFLTKSYERFFEQAFDLAVAHLRVVRPIHPDRAAELDPLSLALIKVFSKACPSARARWAKDKAEPFTSDQLQELRHILDASYINLDKAFLWEAELPNVFMPNASLKETDLSAANLRGARLWSGNLYKAKLVNAKLEDADLGVATLMEADLSEAQLCRAALWMTDLSKAKLCGTDLSGARLHGTHKETGAKLTEAILRAARLEGADLREVNLEGADLCGANLSGANLEGAILSKAKYNSQEITGEDAQGKEFVIRPTQWPSGFNPNGAVDVSTPSPGALTHAD
jgi:uncharacterized protein YjbI with pentapeptide repeats